MWGSAFKCRPGIIQFESHEGKGWVASTSGGGFHLCVKNVLASGKTSLMDHWSNYKMQRLCVEFLVWRKEALCVTRALVKED